MDTTIQNVDQSTLVDLFPLMGNTPTNQVKPTFGSEIVDVNLFSSSTEETTTVSSSTEETTTVSSSTEETTTIPTGDPDITRVEKTVTPITDLTSYFEDRIKTGKFIAVEQEDDKGNKTSFIPKTAEEYDEVLELQLNYRVDQAKKDLEKSWYESKSPAWKVISRYAELIDDPTQIIPFLQGVRTLQSVANLDENEIESAEQIVRVRLSQRGDPEEIVNGQIEALKTTDKLVSTAKQYKPIIIQEEQAQLASEMRQKEEENNNYLRMIGEIREAAIKELEQPIFGKTKLKQEEKADIYDLIGEPNSESQGYGIYSVIDSLFEKKDFKTLKEVAFLLKKRESFYNYLGNNVANQTAVSLEKKLRLAGNSHKSSGNDYDEEQVTIQRNQFKTKPTFGRG
jgi:hypothetical protein